MGIWDWLKGSPEKKYKQRFPESKKPSEPPTEEQETPTPEPDEASESTSEVAGETAEESAPEPQTEAKEEQPPEPSTKEIKESVSQPPSEETEEQISEVVTDSTGEPALESSTEEIDKPTLEPTAEESEEQPPEAVTDEKSKQPPEPVPEESEPPLEPVSQELGELAPEPPAEKKEVISKPSKFGFLGSFRKRKSKKKTKKKEKESVAEPEFFKILILPITLASMLLGLSIMPLFPQPLPAILAFLIAFLAYKKPILGMPIGGLIVGLGLMYNLAKMDFISMLGDPGVRQATVFVFLFLFTVLPIIFRSRKAVISINLGIIAAISLFFSQTYFLAIPIIFTAIALFKKTLSSCILTLRRGGGTLSAHWG